MVDVAAEDRPGRDLRQRPEALMEHRRIMTEPS